MHISCEMTARINVSDFHNYWCILTAFETLMFAVIRQVSNMSSDCDVYF